MKFEIVEELADMSSDWDRFVEIAEGSTCFLTSRWTCSVARLTGVPIRRVAAVNSVGLIVGGAIIAARRHGPLALARKPWATPYCGPVFAPGLPCRDRLRIGEAVATHLWSHYDYVRLDTGLEFRDLLAFQKQRWRVRVRNTYRLTRPARPVRDHIEPSARRHLRKLETHHLRIIPSDDPVPFFGMYRDLYVRQGKPVRFLEKDFELFCSALLSSGQARLLYVRRCDETLAGMLVSRWRNTHFYTLSAFRREHADSAGPTLLISTYLENCLKPGEVFDFVGANPDTPSVNAFKRTFNPQECPYLALERRSWMYRIVEPAARLSPRSRAVGRFLTLRAAASTY